MYIYSITSKNGNNEIYIGKTKNIRNRMYNHKSKSKYSSRKLYYWIREQGGFNNINYSVIKECSIEEVDYYESYYINKYEQLGYLVLNEQHTKSYKSSNNYYKHYYNNIKDNVINLYNSTNLSIYNIAKKFNVSESLISKIINEQNKRRKFKLENYYKEIQDKIVQGVPIRQLAREYKVAKNSISNINKGITAYNPNLKYPLNKN